MSPDPTSPIQHRKKADLAYEYLREQIVNGTYAPGRRMILAELSAELGLSHMPVREALLRLAQEGLLEGAPHRGMSVAALSAPAAQELFEIRCELEGLAAAKAAGSGDAALPGDLRRLNADFAEALARKDYPAMGAANWAFHRRILASAGNEQLSRVLEDVWTGSARFRLGYQLIPGRADHTIREHEAMIVAIEQADAEAARKAARAHISRAGEELARAVKEGVGE